MNDVTQSLLSRDESNAIKGVLISLIILGHNMFFTYATDEIQCMGYLYCFHIQAFFLLPFLYPLRPGSRERVLNHLIRYYVPFFLFLIVLSLLRSFAGHEIEWWKMPLSALFGGGVLIREFAGNQLLWFLPAMFFTVLLKEWYQVGGQQLRRILLFCGVVCITGKIIAPSLSGKAAELSEAILYWGSNLLYALQFLPLGLSLRYILQNRRMSLPMAGGLFLLGSAGYFADYFLLVKPYYSYHVTTSLWVALQMFMPIPFLVLLYRFRAMFGNCKILKKFGENSFMIYLFHPFIGYALFFFLSRRGMPLWFWIVPVQLIMMFLPLWMAGLLHRFPRLEGLLLPRDWRGFLNAIRDQKGIIFNTPEANRE